MEGLASQVGLVRAALGARLSQPVPVHGALCFIEGELSLLSAPKIDGLWVLSARALARRLNAAGPLTAGEARAALACLDQRFPAFAAA